MKRVVFAVVVLLAGAGSVWLAVQYARTVRVGRDWPTVEGKILERGVGEPMGHQRYRPHVRYRYVVDGKTYENTQVYAIKDSGELEDHAEELVRSLPDPVPVHYDPTDPSRSFLILNPSGMFWVIVGFACFSFLVGGVLLVSAYGARKGNP